MGSRLAPIITQSFIHPDHPLKLFSAIYQEYVCHVCKTPGSDTGYRCDKCNIFLHDCCATCPPALSSFMHPPHQLSLVRRTPEAVRQNERLCDLCLDSIEGYFYRCKACDFDIHPVCTKLPEQLRHVVHAQHPLRLQKRIASGWCAVCTTLCSSWSFGCDTCKVYIHIDCVLEVVPDHNVIPPPPSAVPCPIHQPPSTPPHSWQSPPTSTSRHVPMANPPPQQFVPGGYCAEGIPVGQVPNQYNYQHHAGHDHVPLNNFYQFRPPQFNEKFVLDQGQGGSFSSTNSGNSNGSAKIKKFMFAMVGKIAVGALTQALFGVDFSSLMS